MEHLHIDDNPQLLSTNVSQFSVSILFIHQLILNIYNFKQNTILHIITNNYITDIKLHFKHKIKEFYTFYLRLND